MEEENFLIPDDSDESTSEEKISNLSIYDIYASDVGAISCLNTEKNRILLIELNDVISKLDKLFLDIGYDISFFQDNRITWIADKVDYCLKNSNDKELLSALKDEYNKFLLLSSKVIEGNLRLVIEIAGDYKENSLFSFEDIIQYGNIGLMKAVEKYNLDCGTAFSTYARIWIKQVISRNMNGVKSTYRIPSNVVYDGYNLMKKNNELDLLLGRECDLRELSEYMQLPVSKIEELKVAFYDSVSLDESLGLFYGDVEMTRGDMVADPDVDVYMDGICSTRMQELETELQKRLTPRQFEVISRYIGIDGIDYNLEEIALLMNLSSQRVGQLKREAIKRLSLMPAFISKTLY